MNLDKMMQQHTAMMRLKESKRAERNERLTTYMVNTLMALGLLWMWGSLLAVVWMWMD